METASRPSRSLDPTGCVAAKNLDGEFLIAMKTSERGYGAAHQKLRLKWLRAVERGEVVCWRCGNLIAPGARWDLGHDDLDRSQYRGPEHLRCNRGTKGRRAGVQPRRRQSREW